MEPLPADIAPDIETASPAYAQRFAGSVGQFFLTRQAEAVLSMLEHKPLTILEVGGGHLQLTQHLLNAGHKICIHGSSELALGSARELAETHTSRLDTVVSPLTALPFADKSFDVVIAMRLLCHMDSWEKMIDELCRVSRHCVIMDYPPSSSFNFLYPLLFGLKARLEKNTRTYLRFDPKEIAACLRKSKFSDIRQEREFFFPMVIHRVLKWRRLSELMEAFASWLGLTNKLGSPVVICATYVMDTKI